MVIQVIWVLTKYVTVGIPHAGTDRWHENREGKYEIENK